jgi:hypothetical protein
VWGRLVARVLRRVGTSRRRRFTGDERQLRDLRLDALVRNRGALGRAAFVTALACLVELVLLPGGSEFRGFLTGGLAASTYWMIRFKLRELTRRHTSGVEAEARTANLISEVPRWLAVDGVAVGGRILGHVVVTPLAVLAVETTWWGEASVEVHQGRRQAALDQARKNAVSVKRLLRAAGFDLPVWPVVVAWGPGAEPTRLGPVDVVAGEDARSWVAAYQNGAIDPGLAARAHVALLADQAANDEHREAA